MRDEQSSPSWHSLRVDEIIARLGSGVHGLTQLEATTRLARTGANELPPEQGDPAWVLFVRQFKTPLMYIMMGAIVVSYLLGHRSDTIFICAVALSNALVGFWQEHKANRSLRALKRLVKDEARVVRDGIERGVPAAELVPGDILVLRAGDRIPADARVLSCQDARVSEASLTGESRPVTKSTDPVSPDAELGDRTSMFFMGTVMQEGSARALVVETGIRTEYGDIVRLLKETPEEPTPLQRTVASLSKIIGLFIASVVSLIVLEGYLVGRPVDEVFAAALALFVSAIPEGLLPAITIVLALGMRRILKQHGLVRRLAATETLGGVTVICTDKTGTLTEGNMRVERVLADGDDSEVGKKQTQAILRIGALVNDGYIENPKARTEALVVRGNPTEQALLRAAHAAHIDRAALDEAEPQLDMLLFSSERKYAASLRRAGTSDHLYVLGAPEKVLERLAHAPSKAVLTNMEALSKEGYRVVACAQRLVERTTPYHTLEDLAKELTFVGFIVLADPVRADAPRAFAQTARAGIRTVVITGDHKWTAGVVARSVGLAVTDALTLEGHEIESMSDEELRERSRSILLYARVSPRHKLRIVRALQTDGHVVAMFGDGVNDAPALKVADIGVAVGSEVDAVREVADLVLLKSGFKTMVKAVEQGRIIFDNIRRVFLYLIVQDFSQFFLFIGSLAAGLPLPLLPAQLLLVNLVESGLPDLALTTEQEKKGVMTEPPRPPRQSVLDKRSARFMVSVFAISGGIAMIFYVVVLHWSGDIELTRTMVMSLMCLESLFLALSMRSFRRRMFRLDIFSNHWLTGAIAISVVMLLAAVYAEPLQNLLATVPLGPHEWLMVVVTNLVGIILIDTVKTGIFGTHRRIVRT